jgi:glucokinase
MTYSKRPILGIDLGGTKIVATVFDAALQPLGSSKRETKAMLGYAEVVRRIAKTVKEAIDEAGIRRKAIASIGIGSPGPVGADASTILVAPNLGWTRRNLGRDLGALLEAPVVVGNDVNCGALGESVAGAARGAASAFAVFVGTGLGGGLVIDGRVVNGAHGFAGEIGHLPMPGHTVRCGCGQPGCLETLASKTGLVRMIGEAVTAGRRCTLPAFANGVPKGGAAVKSKELRAAWKSGCPATRQAVERMVDALAWGLAAVGQVVDPERFVLGGGVIEAMGRDLRPLLVARVRAGCLLYRQRRPDIRIAELGDAAVAVGAAALAREAR